MTNFLGSTSTYFNNYFESHTPKDEDDFLKPVERARTARFMDYGGKIPIVGVAFGLIRMIGSLAIGIVALIGEMITKDGTAFKYWAHLKERAWGEICRGFLEIALLGIMITHMDWHFNQKESNSRGVLVQFPRGRYVYFRREEYYYSNTRFEGKAERCQADGHDNGTELRFDEAAIHAAEDGSKELR